MLATELLYCNSTVEMLRLHFKATVILLLSYITLSKYLRIRSG
jgi:hypothetical protein